MKYFAFKLKTARTQNGYPVLLSLRAYQGQNIVRRFCNTDTYVDELEYWDKRQEKIVGGKKRGEANLRLQQLRTHLEGEILKFKVNNPNKKLPMEFLVGLLRESTNDIPTGDRPMLIAQFWQKHQESLLEKKKYNTSQQFKIGLSSFRRMVKKADRMTFEDVNASMVELWDDAMKNSGLMPNSRSYVLRAFRAVLKLAISQGLMDSKRYPFGTKYETNRFCISVHTRTTTPKRYLPNNFLQSVANYQSSDIKKMWAVRLWLFSFYCRGINLRDMATLTKDSIKTIMGPDGVERQFITYNRAKTGKRFEIPYTDTLKRMVSEMIKHHKVCGQYLLPIMNMHKFADDNEIIKHLALRRKTMNKYLKQVAEDLEFPDSLKVFTTYTSRHSYAQFLYNNNAPLPVISEALGHADLETTRIYFNDSGNIRLSQWDNIVQNIGGND